MAKVGISRISECPGPTLTYLQVWLAH